MQKYTGAGFSGVDIEHNFAIFLQQQIGARGKHWDADFFRAGDRKQIGAAIADVAKKLEARVKSIQFSAKESENGGSKARLDVAVKLLSDIAAEMQKSKTAEPDDYHWMIVAQLLLALGSILDHYGV